MSNNGGLGGPWQSPQYPNVTDLAQLAALRRLEAGQAAAIAQQAQANAALLHMQYLALTPAQRAEYDAEVARQQAEAAHERAWQEALLRYHEELAVYRAKWCGAFAAPVIAIGASLVAVANDQPDVVFGALATAAVAALLTPVVMKAAERVVPPVNPDGHDDTPPPYAPDWRGFWKVFGVVSLVILVLSGLVALLEGRPNTDGSTPRAVAAPGSTRDPGVWHLGDPAPPDTGPPPGVASTFTTPPTSASAV